jgi:hypothetical protein
MLAALRRLLFLVVLSAAVTTVGSLLFGLLIRASLDRAISLGFYGVGCFLMVSGFFIGNRGPARVRGDASGFMILPIPGLHARRLRWASREEQEETINNSAVFVVLGVIMIVIAVLVDSRHSLV